MWQAPPAADAAERAARGDAQWGWRLNRRGLVQERDDVKLQRRIYNHAFKHVAIHFTT